MTSRTLTWLPLVAAVLLLAVLLAGCTTAPSGPSPTTTQPTTVTITQPATTVPTTVPATTAPLTTISTPVPPATTTAAPTPVLPALVAVTIQNFAFSPASVEVPRGTMVTWTNKDSVPHTVMSDMTQKFASPTLEPGRSFSFTFTEPGSYPYHCSIHTTMHGNVIVT